MSVKAMTAVWYESQAEGNDRLVLLAIADRAGDFGDNAWPTLAELEIKTKLSLSTIRRCNKTLVELGELAIEKNAGGSAKRQGNRRPNLYTVILPSLVERGVNLIPQDDQGFQNDGLGVSDEGVRGVSPTPNSEHIRPSYTSGLYGTHTTKKGKRTMADKLADLDKVLAERYPDE